MFIWTETIIGENKSIKVLWVLTGMTPFIGLFILIIFLFRFAKACQISIQSIINDGNVLY
jgi:hypothetical protein